MWPKKKALYKALEEQSKKNTAEDLIKQEQYRRDKFKMMTGKMTKEEFKKKRDNYIKRLQDWANKDPEAFDKWADERGWERK